jgi:hypothetical protein
MAPSGAAHRLPVHEKNCRLAHADGCTISVRVIGSPNRATRRNVPDVPDPQEIRA